MGKKAKRLRDAKVRVSGEAKVSLHELPVEAQDYVPASLHCLNNGVLTLPAGWSFRREVPYWTFRHCSGMLVLASEQPFPSGPEKAPEQWLHVSASRRDGTPTWADMASVKEMFIGPDREALQIHPPQDEYVNLHPFCLHLWCNLKRRVAPDFRKPDEIWGLTI